MVKGKIIEEFEELIKLFDFFVKKKKVAYENTLERISNALKTEYADSINEKIIRWAEVTRFQYFQESTPVKFYLQAKMLYRDGYFESAIMITRSICEMICQDLLTKIPHPFGSNQELEQENFRTLIKFIAIPKEIPKNIFEDDIINKLTDITEKNFLKSSYEYIKTNKLYKFKIQVGKKTENTNTLFKALDTVGFTTKDNFDHATFILLDQVYSNGNTYIHARTSPNNAQTDALNIISGIGRVLFYIYTIKSILGKRVKSGYTDFPNISTGISYFSDVYFSPEAAERGYYNFPTEEQVNKMLTLVGTWAGEWKNEKSINVQGNFVFTIDGEYLTAKLQVEDEGIDLLHIQLFGEYFHIIGRRKFKLEFLNVDTLIGKNIDADGKALFKRK